MQHQQQQQHGVSMTLSGQQGGTAITTMAAHPQAVQVIQQPMQSQVYHLQHLYNTQGTPLYLNPQSIQVFTHFSSKLRHKTCRQISHMELLSNFCSISSLFLVN